MRFASLASAAAATAASSSRLPMNPLVAVGQLTSTEDRDQNIRRCRDLAVRAKKAGAALLCLPECFSLVGSSWRETVAAGQPIEGPMVSEMRTLAKEQGLWLSLGGFPEKMPSPQNSKIEDSGDENERVYNTHIVLDDKGDIKALYRKIHLFDVNFPNGPVLQESKYTAPGAEVVVIDSPIGRLGLSTCYDLRFPELYQALVKRGAEVLLVPSAFTVLTGQAHWEILLRARAIETQCYVLASAQAGQHNEKRASYGHSLIVDPWGKVMEDAGGDASPALVMAEIDLKRLHEIRAKIPVQLHRRRDVFFGVSGVGHSKGGGGEGGGGIGTAPSV
ncbi:hypothetical protein VYU27_000873 [Nannochloropsis oceanica]